MIMTYYSVPHLTTLTPDSARIKLTKALQAVTGVEGVILQPATNQFEIRSDEKEPPKAAEIASASMKAGFKSEARPKTK